MARGVLRLFAVTPQQLREDPGRLGEILDRVDTWIADGVLNGDQLNCADFQIASSLALVDYRLDVAGDLNARPAGELMERVLPQP